MSPLEYIEEGICKGNWEIVCEGYERLTGKTIPIPIKSAAAEFALRQIADIISATKVVTENGEDASILLDVSKKTAIQRETSGTRLITNDPNAEEIEQNKIKAAKSQSSKAKLKKRQTTETYDVECNECEKTFKSNRKSGEIGQKCPKCLKDKKR